ncbi:MAG: efflux RND transporter periplasmic adaptor subunit [Candidatus Jidaibacter sp.]|jgi:membrane fusion protein (multidrug efflux system)|nr:efflux RND transporter periplasmic adaptor subunit [Candidatus Jidaibacter sp.]
MIKSSNIIRKPTALIFIFSVIALLSYYFYNKHVSDKKTKEPAAINVTVAPAAIQKISSTIQALGTIHANESVNLSASVIGSIDKFYALDGALVKSGDIIFTLDHAEEDASLAGATATMLDNQRELTRLKNLSIGINVTLQQVDMQAAQFEVSKQQVNSLQKQIEKKIIKAPFDGLIGVSKLSVGAVTQPGQAVVTIDDISSMKLDFTVPSAYLSQLNPGQKIIATTDAFPVDTFTGTIQTIDTRVDPISRSVSVRAIAANPDLKLRPGLLMRVNIIQNERDAIVVPEESIVQRTKDHFVFVADQQESIAHIRKVEIGQRISGFVEIISGLQVNELIVTRGSILLSDGKKIAISTAKKG